MGSVCVGAARCSAATAAMLGPGALILLLASTIPLLSLVHGGCSFSQEGGHSSTLRDMDPAKLAAKMAIAHQGLDIDITKAGKTDRHAEQYVPTFFTSEDSKETNQSLGEAEEAEDAIWSLSQRSNRNSPRQDLGRTPSDKVAPPPAKTGCPHSHTEL